MSPRTMLFLSFFVLSLSLAGGTALASNQSNCNSWCGGRSDCDYCGIACGLEARSIQNFTEGFLDFTNLWYYACQKYSTATRLNKEDCERWCDANNNDPNASIYCDRCDAIGCNIFTSVERHYSSVGAGDDYHACEDFDKATQRNMTTCQAWCAAEGRTCDYCSENLLCGWQWPWEARIIKPFGSYGWASYACQTAATATRLNKEGCESWCGTHACDQCVSDFCPANSTERNSWTSFGTPWRACENYVKASERNLAACENWCSANKDINAGVYCDRCTADLCIFPSVERHLSWSGYGDGYRACEDWSAASQRHKTQCDQYCSSNPADCNYCIAGPFCDSWSKTVKTFSGYGATHAACKNEILFPLPGFTPGPSQKRFDLIFVMDRDYNGDKEKFLIDAQELANDLVNISPFSKNRDKLNFYYTSIQVDIFPVAGNATLNIKDKEAIYPSNLLPLELTGRTIFADAYAILHKRYLFNDSRFIRDYAYPAGNQWVFSANSSAVSSFIHEAGHAFGLADEYIHYNENTKQEECTTPYWRPWESNIWNSELSCRSRAEAEGWDKTLCYKFTGCEFGWWKHGNPILQDDNSRYEDPKFSFIMKDSSYYYINGNGYGDASERIIQSVFDRLSNRSLCEEQSVAMQLSIDKEGKIELLGTKAVSGCSPNCLSNGGAFTAKIISENGSLITECGFLDPRIGYAQSDSSGAIILDEAKFDLILPLSGKAARAEIVENSTEKTLVSADLSSYATGKNGKPVADPGPKRTVEFSNSGVTLDGSKSYDPDGDPLTYEWSWKAGAASGVSPTALLVPGTENVTLTVSDGELSDSYSAEITVEAAQPPVVAVTKPSEGAEMQGTVRLTADASDLTGVANLSFYVRKPDDNNEGVPVDQEDLGGFLVAGTRKSGTWDMTFDTTQLLDGQYVVFTHSADQLDNEGWSQMNLFGIRNWQLAARLPSSANNKAGRTMPLKFSVRMKQAVDPAQSFVRNEELEIRVYDTAAPGTVLQTFHYGDSSDAYRIDDAAEEYIANFKTLKGLAAEYAVEVWRANTNWMIGKFLFKTVK